MVAMALTPPVQDTIPSGNDKLSVVPTQDESLSITRTTDDEDVVQEPAPRLSFMNRQSASAKNIQVDNNSNLRRWFGRETNKESTKTEPQDDSSTEDNNEESPSSDSVEQEQAPGRFSFMSWQSARAENVPADNNSDSKRWFHRETNEESAKSETPQDAPTEDESDNEDQRIEESEKATVPPGRFRWFRGQAQQGTSNLDAINILDKAADRNENQEQERRSRFLDMYRGNMPTNDLDKNDLKDLFRSYREKFETAYKESLNTPAKNPPTNGDDNAASASAVPSTRRWGLSATSTAPSTRRWGLFRRAVPTKLDGGVQDETDETAIVKNEPDKSPVIKALRKAGAAVSGACMVIVGVPLLLFPIPGPGVAMIASGVYVVSKEFESAQPMLESIENKFGSVLDQIGIQIGKTGAALPTSEPPALTAANSNDTLVASDEGGSIVENEEPDPHMPVVERV